MCVWGGGGQILAVLEFRQILRFDVGDHGYTSSISLALGIVHALASRDIGLRGEACAGKAQMCRGDSPRRDWPAGEAREALTVPFGHYQMVELPCRSRTLESIDAGYARIMYSHTYTYCRTFGSSDFVRRARGYSAVKVRGVLITGMSSWVRGGF